MSYCTAEFDCHADRPQILDLWSRNLPEGSAARYAWLYESGRAAGWLVHSQQATVVGSTGVMVRNMRVFGRPVRAGQAIDMNVDAGHRTLGPAIGMQRLLTAAVAEGRFDLVYAFPNAQSMAVLKRVGYRTVGEVQRWYYPIRWENVLRDRLRQPFVRKLAAATADLAVQLRGRDGPRTTAGGGRVSVTDCFDERFDRLWQASADRFAVVGERTSAYLNWRFGQSPQGPYRTFCLSGPRGDLSAYVVYYRSEGVVHVNDFFFSEVDDLQMLLAAFLRRMREEKAAAVTAVYLGPDRAAEVFRRLGFFRRPAPWTVTAYVSRERWGPPAGQILDKDGWYLTRADVDTDL
jgi:hypothetical protein